MNARRTLAPAWALLLIAAVTAARVTGAQDAPQVPASAPCAPGAVYDPACDVDHDSDVDVLDIQLAAGHWNQTGVWTGGDYWSLTGNAGTTPATHFVGTTDNQALELKVNNQRALRLDPNTVSPNLIGGYHGNNVTAGVKGASIAGGGKDAGLNRVTDDYGAVGGGRGNVAGNNDGVTTDAAYATVSGGSGNSAGVYAATVGGGYANTASGEYAAVGGGYANTASGGFATVGGGYVNTASGESATVSGGRMNAAIGSWSVVGGGKDNHAVDNYDTVSGGENNDIVGVHSTIGGGSGNSVNGVSATIAGGRVNDITNDYATVGGGTFNSADGEYSTVGGGHHNTAGGTSATISGGADNTADGVETTIGGGLGNTASGRGATVPGGSHGVASHYGEQAYASGSFAAAGDAQTSLYVLRQETGDASLTELFLDGSAERITLVTDRVMTFDILVVASHRFGGGSSAGYQVAGVIRNIGGVTAFVGTPIKTVLGENVAGWDIQVEAEDTVDALVVKVQGSSGTTIRWVASVRTVEVGR